MVEKEKTGNPRLWISYPWVSREDRDFTYLVTQLKTADIEATYDSLQLLPDMNLRERAVQRLLSVGFDGWLYILTHQCFTRKKCADELAAAVEQALRRVGPDFPMAGLLYGIASQHVPTALRVKPCVSLADPDWMKQLSEIFRFRAAHGKRTSGAETRFVWSLHPSYCGDRSMTVIEVHARDEGIEHWRFALPRSVQPISWGQGPSGGKGISRVGLSEATGSGKFGSQDIFWFGAANSITRTESAYLVLSEPLPEFICFGPAQGAFGPPGQLEVYRPSESGK
jgi:hypothetical protein